MAANSTSSPQISRIPVHGSSSNTNLLDMIGRNGSGDSPSVGMSSSYGASNMIPTAIVSPTRSFASAASGDRSSPAPRIILDCSGEEMENHLDKLLECPVCFEVILPPIMSCVEGHSWCQSCHASLQRCPVCRGNFMGVRNLLVEQFLEKCRFKCKHHNVGCSTVLPARELVAHYRNECPHRPIFCHECNSSVPFDEFLTHLKDMDKIQMHNASECSTGFEIDDQDFYETSRRSAVWEPTWMNCYGENFLTYLEFNGTTWWVWVASLTETGCKYRCQITLWNKDIKSEITFKGRVQPIRSNAQDVFLSGECLIMAGPTLRKFVYRRGIDVLVRIEKNYEPPLTRRGQEVQSPLIVASRGNSSSGNTITDRQNIQADHSNRRTNNIVAAAADAASVSISRQNSVLFVSSTTSNPASTTTTTTSNNMGPPPSTPVSRSTPSSEEGPSSSTRSRTAVTSTGRTRRHAGGGPFLPESPPVTRSHQSRRLLFDAIPSPRNSRRPVMGITSLAAAVASFTSSSASSSRRATEQNEDDIEVIEISSSSD